ncbi:MAG: GAF domain-containing protein [Nostoc sp.]
MANNKSKNDALSNLPEDSLVPLEAILCNEELSRRPSRPPDYETENRALARLVQALADAPRDILQTLADEILNVFKADSSGISLLTKDEKRFYWPAIAGEWKPHIGSGTPREFGPCGDVLDYNVPLLFRHFELRYTYFLPITPLIEECLLVPFYVEGKAVGTIWAITHNDRRKFDLEDLRQLKSLEKFASAAYQAVESLDELTADLQDTQLLQELGARLVTEGNVQTLYQELISAAIAITQAQAGTIQLLDVATQELVMLAMQNITPAMFKHFSRVDARSNTSCGMALQSGERAFIDFDVPESQDPDGSCRVHVEAGYLSAQSTPLITRSG